MAMISKEVINEVAKFMVRGSKIRCKGGILLVIKVNLNELLKISFLLHWAFWKANLIHLVYCLRMSSKTSIIYLSVRGSGARAGSF